MDDYRARFKSWKCPVRGELTISGHFAAIDDAIGAQLSELDRLNRGFGCRTNYRDQFLNNRKLGPALVQGYQ